MWPMSCRYMSWSGALPDARTRSAWNSLLSVEEVVDPVAVDGLGLPLDQLVEVREVLVGQQRDGEADGERLERLAHLVGLEELLVAERRDDRAAARAHGHEPLRGEPAEGLADGSAADAEGRGERHLGEHGARRQPVGEDLVAQVRVDPLPQREVLDRPRDRARPDRPRSPPPPSFVTSPPCPLTRRPSLG